MSISTLYWCQHGMTRKWMKDSTCIINIQNDDDIRHEGHIVKTRKKSTFLSNDHTYVFDQSGNMGRTDLVNRQTSISVSKKARLYRLLDYKLI